MRISFYTIIINVCIATIVSATNIDWQFSYDNKFQDMGVGAISFHENYLIYGVTQPYQYSSNHALIICLTPNGDSLWSAVYDSSIIDNYPIEELFLTSDTSAIYFGTSYSKSTFSDLQIGSIDLNLSGKKSWERIITDTTRSQPIGIHHIQERYYVITRNSNGYKLGYSTIDGIYHHVNNLDFLQYTSINSSIKTKDNRILCVGSNTQSPGGVLNIFKIDTLGSQIWLKEYSEFDSINAYDISATTNDLYAVSASHTFLSLSYLTYINSNGDIKYTYIDSIYKPLVYSPISIMPNGLIIKLYGHSSDSSCITLLNPSGHTLWRKPILLATSNHNSSILLNPDKSFLITGSRYTEYPQVIDDLVVYKFTTIPSPHHIHILSTWDGDTTNTVDGITITTDDSLTLFSSGFDSTGMFWGYYADTWQPNMTSGSFGITLPDTHSFIFRPTAPGTGTLTATYIDSLDTLTATTGLITVLPGSLHSIRTNNASDGPEQQDTSISTAERLYLHAGAYDAAGNWLRDTTAIWYTTGTLDSTAFEDPVGTQTVYKPRIPGSGYIVARYSATLADSFAVTVYNTPPAVAVTGPTATVGNGITVSYVISDNEQDSIYLECEFSLDNGYDWHTATLQQPSLKYPLTYAGTLTWLSHHDIPGRVRDSVLFRVTPHDAFSRGHRDTTAHFPVRNLLGDCNHDLTVGFDDLDLFAGAWYGEDVSYDIGPATGTLPSLIPLVDGRLDHEDVYVFMRMWNWSFDDSLLNGPVAKNVFHTGNIPVSLVRHDNVYRIRYTDTGSLRSAGLTVTGNGISTVTKGTPFSDGSVRGIFLNRINTTATRLSINTAILDGELPPDAILAEFAADTSEAIALYYDVRYRDGGATTGAVTAIANPAPGFAGQDLAPGINPSNGPVCFGTVAHRSGIRIIIMDINGNEIRTITPDAGQRLIWDGSDNSGNRVPAGLYYWGTDDAIGGRLLRVD